MAPTIARTIAIVDSGATVNLNTLTSPAFSPAAGELLVMVGVSGAGSQSFGTISDTSGLTWTSRVVATDGTSNQGLAQIWTAQVGATAPGSITVSVTATGSAGWRTLCGSGWSNAALAATPATHSVVGSTTVSDTITTAAASSVVVWGDADWNAAAGTPAYRSSATEIAHDVNASFGGAYSAWQNAASAGSQTYGMTAPTGQKAAMAAIEVQASSTALTRTASDTASAADSATRAALTRTRTATDTAPASDAATIPVNAVRTATDSAPATDVAGKLLPRAAADTAPASDGAARAVQSFTRTVTDLAAASDTAARAVGLVRGPTDTAPAADTVGPPVVVHATNASPNWPLMGFEVDFNSGPPARPGVARKSINAAYRRLFVRKWDTARGRQYELDQVAAGTANLMLPDPLEYLNPDNTSSPFNTGGRQITPYRAMWLWGMWPNQPGSGNVINKQVLAQYDPSFETSGGLWFNFSGTNTALSTAQAFHGVQSLLITQGTPGQSSYGVYNSNLRTAPGVSYTFSCYVYPTGGTTVSVQVNLADGTTATSASASAQNVWTRLSVSWTTVDTLETVNVLSAQANPTFYLDATMLEFGFQVSPFTTSGPTLYPIFTGYVERYPTTFDMAGFRAIRPLQAVDALAILSRTAINQSYDAEVAADNPAVYYRLDNRVSPATSSGFDMGAAGPKIGAGMGPGAVPYFTVSASGSINWAGDSHPDGTPAVAFTGQNSANPPTSSAPNSFTEMPVQGGFVTLDPQAGFSWECWVRFVSGTAQVGTFEVLAPGNIAELNQTVPLIGGLNFINALGIAYNPDGTRFQYFTRGAGAIFPDGVWHYLYMTVTGGTFKVGFDGDGLSGAITTNSVGPIAFNTFYSMASAQYSIAQAQNSTGRAAVYRSVLTNARFLAHYRRGTGYYGETSGARITRLLSKYWLGATSVAPGRALLAPDFSYSPVSTGGQASQSRTVLDVSQEIQETERGLFYVSAPGTVVFEDRSSRYLNQAPQVVFGENPNPVTPINSNPYFTVDASGWTVTGGSFTRTTAYHLHGAGAGLLAPDGVSGTPLIRSVPAAATAGTGYTGDVYLYSDVAVGSVSVFVDWLNGSGTQIGTSPTQNVALAAGVWTKLSCAGVAPATTATARLAVVMFGTPPATSLLYVDDARLYLSSQVDEYPYTDVKYDHDPTYTFSQANLSSPANGSFAPMVRSATQAKYGQRILTQTVQVNQNFDLTQAGIFYLQRYGTPATRVNTLVLNPAANPALFPIILSLELSQRVTVTRRSAFNRSSDYYIEKIAHSVDAEAGSWTTTLQLSPVFVPQAWVCGDATYGVLGTTTIPIY